MIDPINLYAASLATAVDPEELLKDESGRFGDDVGMARAYGILGVAYTRLQNEFETLLGLARSCQQKLSALERAADVTLDVVARSEVDAAAYKIEEAMKKGN